MDQSSRTSFSVKALILSLIFIGIVASVAWLKSNSNQDVAQNQMAPTLHFESDQAVLIRAPYENEFYNAISGQSILSGSILKTGEDSTAELRNQNNRVALGSSTTLHLLDHQYSQPYAYHQSNPRFTFNMDQGSLWVHATDSMEINLPQVTAHFNHASGFLSHDGTQNTIAAQQGAIQLALKTDSGEMVNQIDVPLNNHVSFADAQITPNYATLKDSKLKKEIRMVSLSPEFFANELVASHDDFEPGTTFPFPLKTIDSDLAYRLENSLNNYLSLFAFREQAQANLVHHQVEREVGYLVGEVSQSQDLALAQDTIARLNQLVLENPEPLEIEYLLSKAGAQVRSAAPESPAALLRDYLVKSEEVSAFQLYLTDVDKYLRQQNLPVAEQLLAKWESQWSSDLIVQNLSEYRRQSHILSNTLISNIELASLPLLDTFDRTGENLMQFSDDLEETRFEVADERLKIASSLVLSYRYTLAKQYLRNSYLALNIQSEDQSLASIDLFIQRGTLLAQRIDYAMAVLNGAPGPVDEADFTAYIQDQIRNNRLTEDLAAFFDVQSSDSSEVVTQVNVFSESDVTSDFAAAGLRVDPLNISPLKTSSFEFEVMQVVLDNTTSQQSGLITRLVYDASTGTAQDIELVGQQYDTTLLLADLNLLLSNASQLNSDQNSQVTASIDSLLTAGDNLNALENQALSYDLAIRLATNQLSEVGVQVVDVTTNVEILNLEDLNEFHIKRALVENHSDQEVIPISFNYSSQSLIATQVKDEEGNLLLAQVPAEQLEAQAIQAVLNQREAREATKDFILLTERNDLQILPDDVTYDLNNKRVNFANLNLEQVNVQVSGAYDLELEQFAVVTHPLLTSQNIDLKEYFENLVDRLVIQALLNQGIQISADQVQTTYPFRVIRVNEALIDSSTFNFDLNLEGETVSNIKHLDTNMSLEDMTLPQLVNQAILLRQQNGAEEGNPLLQFL